ncbi:hypothetical protein [Enterococcus sp. AZ103]|uniref:hypothetical protein n=1 Tax=Enterococcus sp. AZ103 TaxID=2774628 RepID=UPI003F24433A
MSYMNFKDYEKLDGRASEEKFNLYYPKAAILLDNITNNFYLKKDIIKDISFRSERFKRALVAQINYFTEMDADTFESLNKAPQSVQIGSTNVSNVSRYNASGSNESKALVPDDVFIYLEGTGLLYRGVPSC